MCIVQYVMVKPTKDIFRANFKKITLLSTLAFFNCRSVETVSLELNSSKTDKEVLKQHNECKEYVLGLKNMLI
jgi:hypothetical protein